MRWVLFDEIVEIKKGQSVRGLSRVPETGEFSTEVLLTEMMAQAGGILMGAENEFKDDVVFGKIEAAEFPVPGTPGEKIEITAVSEALGSDGAWVDGTIKSTRGTIATARIMLTKAGTLVPGKTGSTTFHSGFMSHYKIREKIK